MRRPFSCRGTRIAATAIAAAASSLVFAAASSRDSRTFELKENIVFKGFPEGARSARIWLPVPSSDEHQSVEIESISSPVATRRTTDPEYGNESLYLELPDPARRDVRFDLAFRATRKEYSTDPRSSAAGGPRPPGLGRYLRADRLVPIDGKFRKLSDEITAGQPTALGKARAIYDYVFKTMKYDKSGEGWGRGDSLWACDSRRGNCTDFHSVFISLMRAQGIPARFEIGFPLASAPAAEIPGYHCWAEFYLDGPGWIPVDISEAWKAPARHDYFFGNLDANRIRFSTGRDVTLSPPQKDAPLNYFVYPYAEVDGKPFTGSLERTIRYRETPVSAAK
ncbi:MAG: transglutaminase-like domain-containing protein [Thermoanaerobaculia bacterium]